MKNNGRSGSNFVSQNLGENMNGTIKNKIYGSATVGERGQIVIPADIRKSFSIKPGDKLMVFAKSEMIGLIPMEEFSHFLDQASEALSRIKK
jgi:AbrB family looped-hinge helix DNA binding protein